MRRVDFRSDLIEGDIRVEIGRFLSLWTQAFLSRWVFELLVQAILGKRLEHPPRLMHLER